MTVAEAIKIAKAATSTSSKLHRRASPPVCRITDFDKYRYALKKKAHDSKRGANGQPDQGSQDGRAHRKT